VVDVVAYHNQQVPMLQDDMGQNTVPVIKKEEMKAMTTAKELARKAFCDAVEMQKKGWFDKFSPEDRFESWWSEWYGRAEHKDAFHAERNVYVDGKRYIPAE